MIAPVLWSDTPFKNRTALLDFGGQNALYHQVMVDTLARGGAVIRLSPIGDGIGSPIWQEVHATQHTIENAALGISAPATLTDYDFNDPVSFATFMFIHAQETERQRKAAGIS